MPALVKACCERMGFRGALAISSTSETPGVTDTGWKIYGADSMAWMPGRVRIWTKLPEQGADWPQELYNANANRIVLRI